MLICVQRRSLTAITTYENNCNNNDYELILFMILTHFHCSISLHFSLSVTAVTATLLLFCYLSIVSVCVAHLKLVFCYWVHISLSHLIVIIIAPSHDAHIYYTFICDYIVPSLTSPFMLVSYLSVMHRCIVRVTTSLTCLRFIFFRFVFIIISLSLSLFRCFHTKIRTRNCIFRLSSFFC